MPQLQWTSHLAATSLLLCVLASPICAQPAPSDGPMGPSIRAPEQKALFSVASSEDTLVPVIVRWALAEGLVPVLNGRRVTARSLRGESFADIPLTDEARSVAGPDLQQAISAILKGYVGHHGVQVTATLHPPYFLKITTTRPETDETTASPSMPARAPGAAQPPETPPVVFQAEPTWDLPARKAAGVLSGLWLIGQSATLRSTVQSWAQHGGYALDWQSSRDFPIPDELRGKVFSGSLRDAMTQLAASFGKLDQPLGITFDDTAVGLRLRVIDL